MTYSEAVNYLYSQVPSFQKVGAAGYKEGLDNTLALDAHFGHPHRHFKTIHVAGTNGKGSCSHTMAAILQLSGLKVGLYTSPHLVDFRERIKVNGKMVSQEYVCDFVEQERSFFEPLHPSFFELTTAMAFKYFADQAVDIAVIEVGLGGRLDCTNIITPELCIITNISFDHTQFLGDTLAKIAAEKAGIIKKGIPVVIGETTPETRPVFEEIASKKKAPILFAEDKRIAGITALQRTFELKGDCQKKNARTIVTAARAFGLSEQNISEGMAHVVELTGLAGRWQTLCEKPLVVCDTGHNTGGWKYLAKQIKHLSARHKHIVFGMVDDKDINTVMKMLPKDATYYWTQASTHRAIPSRDVAERGAKHQLHGCTYNTVKEAYNDALAHASTDDFIFVGGSSYVVADLLSGAK